MTASSVARRLAEHLLNIGAVTFAPDRPFTWASGRKAPVYCDNRITISYPAVRQYIRDGFVGCLEDHRMRPDVVAGTATAGIPHAAWLADRLGVPMIYVRSRPKTHGRGAQIEGRIEAGQSAVVIEDLVSTGGSARAVVEVLRDAEMDVHAVLAIFSYELEAAKRTFEELGVPLYTLTRFDDLFHVAGETLSEASIQSILEWRTDPLRWSDQHA